LGDAVSERPILFSSAMVRAILDGTKTQTRRIVKPQWPDLVEFMPGTWAIPTERPGSFEEIKYPWTPGDRLWVREAWRTYESLDHLPPRDIGRGAGVEYVAGGSNVNGHETERLLGMGRYRHACFLPRWTSRITLEVTDVRVERLQEISEADAVAEGARRFDEIPIGSVLSRDNRWSMESILNTDYGLSSARWAFANYWNRVHGPDSWDASPWVWVIGFRRVEAKTEATA
jgi:hypothetical protein